MRGAISLAAAIAVFAGAASVPAIAVAASKHNGGCVGFAGSISRHNYAGIKCYLDSAPGSWIIRYRVMERDNPEEYKQLLRIPKRPFRCTLVKEGELPGNGVMNVTYDIERCG